MKFGKKAQAGSQNWPVEFGFYIILIFVVGLVALIFAISLSNKGIAKTKIDEEVESINIIQRFLESPECFVEDSDGVVLNNVIDTNKFNDERLNSCFSISNANYPAFKLMLKSASFEKEIRTSNWNGNRPLEKSKTKQILVYSEGKTINGELKIEIQNIHK